MRSILASVLAVVLALQSALPLASAADESSVPEWYQKFVVTAYYSPKPDQTLYLRGSYEADIRLNGNGTNGASGKEVFAGMIAAPKTYAFGTRIELSGIGIGIVEDRGGAIVVAGERGYDADRIDIWMGEGEEGLIRALTFGKRTVYGRVLSESSAVSTIDLTSFPSDRKAVIASLSRQSSKIPDAWNASTNTNTESIAVASEPAPQPDDTVDEKEEFVSDAVANEPALSLAVGRASDPEHIREVQEIFVRLGLYSGAVDGVYSNEFYQAIVDFQISRGIIASESDYGAGYYGPKTREAVGAEYEALLEREWEATEAARQATEAERIAAAELEKHLIESKARVDRYIEKLWSPAYGESSKRVRELQKVLSKLGYFEHKDTAYFGDITRDALVRYQLDRGVIASADDPEAGTINEATRQEFAIDLIILVSDEE